MALSIQELVDKARAAQAQINDYTQEQVDAIVRAIGKVVYDNAEELSKMAVEQTNMGVLEDKINKCYGKSKMIWHSLKGKKSVGIINFIPETGIYEVAKPKGVIAAATPSTNPVVTPMCNAMFAIKGKNAIIIAPHPKAKALTKHLLNLFHEELKKLGAPVDLIQAVEEPSGALRNELMATCDVCIATGGVGAVKAAYGSGKPAFGVGVGNVQCIIDRDTDYKAAVPKIIAGRIFDNGIICSGEQSIIAPKEKFNEIMEEFKNNGAFYVEDPAVVETFAKAMFIDGKINRDIVGKSVQTVAKAAGVDVPEGTKVIVLKARGIGKDDVLSKEKMCPVMVAIPYDTFEDAVAIAQANLNVEGKGHSCALHSDNKEHIEYAGEKLEISRLVINQPSSTGAGGSLYNGFNPTTTLGCGSWGNNSISENLTYTHLINISRIGLYNKDAKVPTDEEIWAE